MTYNKDEKSTESQHNRAILGYVPTKIGEKREISLKRALLKA